MKRTILVASILVATTLITQHTQAQFNGGGGGTPGAGGTGGGIPGTGGGPAVPEVPFDGGMSLILAASGIGYVAKKMKKK